MDSSHHSNNLLSTMPGTETLLERISQLERENQELREQNQRHVSMRKLTPQSYPPRRPSMFNNGTSARNIHFDGYRMKFNQIEPERPLSPTLPLVQKEFRLPVNVSDPELPEQGKASAVGDGNTLDLRNETQRSPSDASRADPEARVEHALSENTAGSKLDGENQMRIVGRKKRTQFNQTSLLHLSSYMKTLLHGTETEAAPCDDLKASDHLSRTESIKTDELSDINQALVRNIDSTNSSYPPARIKPTKFISERRLTSDISPYNGNLNIADTKGIPEPVMLPRQRSDRSFLSDKENIRFPLGEQLEKRYTLQTRAQIMEELSEDFPTYSNVGSNLSISASYEDKNVLGLTISSVLEDAEQAQQHSIHLPIDESCDEVLFDQKRKSSASACASKSLETLLQLNLVTKMLHSVKKCSLCEKGLSGANDRMSFQNFFLMTIDPILARNDLEFGLVDGGSSYVRPIAFKSVDCIDQYPSDLQKNDLAPMALSTFCCPDGIKVRLLPRAVLNGARRLGWLGKAADQYKLLAFTNSDGATIHGIAITVFEEVLDERNEMGEFIDALVSQRDKQAAAMKVSNWWRSKRRQKPAYIPMQPITESPQDEKPEKKKKKNLKSKVRNAIKKKLARSKKSFLKQHSLPFDDNSEVPSSDMSIASTSALKSCHKKYNKQGNNMRDQMKSSQSMSTLTRPGQNNYCLKIARRANGYSSDQLLPENGHDLLSQTSKSDIVLNNCLEHRLRELDHLADTEKSHESDINSDETANQKEPSDRAKLLGKEAFEKMNEAEALGNVCIVEKCYVIIGGPQSEQILQLRALQHMIDLERESHTLNKGKGQVIKRDKDTDDSQMLCNILDAFADAKLDDKKEILRNLRLKYLRVMQARMCLSPDQAKIQLPRSDFDIISRSPPTFDADLPTWKSTIKLRIPLPLPHVANHWGVAAILNRVESNDLLLVLKLLLIERSILVLGESSELVTACACALLELIKPFRWASNFMPLLPVEMIDFVNSPVPFVIGIVTKNQHHSELLQKDERVIEAMAEGLSVLNLSSGTVNLTTEAEITDMLQTCSCPRSELSMYQKRLRLLNQHNVSMRSFAAFVNEGLSRQAIVTLNAVCRVIKRFVEGLAGDIASKPDGWKKYGKHDEVTQTFDFYPSLFIEPLREQLENRLQLQEMIAHSQLFIEYVDVRRKNMLKNHEMAEGECGKFIADWIYQHWMTKKLNKLHSASPTS